MQHVKPKWLGIFAYSLLIFDVALYVTYFLFEYLKVSQSIKDYWGITPLILILAAIHFVTTITVFPWLRRKSQWAGFVASMVPHGLLMSAIIETSGNTNLVYRIMFIILVFMLNMVGPYLSIAAAVVAWILLFFDFLSIEGFALPQARSLNVVLDVIVTIAAIIGWLFFRRFYELDDTTKQAAAGLAKDEIAKEHVKTDFMLNSMADGALMIDNTGIIRYMNPAACQISGWDADDAIGLHFNSVLKFYDKNQNKYPEEKNPLFVAVSSGKAVRDNNIIYRTHSGKEIMLSVDAAPLLDNEGGKTGGIICIFRDVSQEKLEEQRRTEFISTASHEMRTPVAAIEGYLALAMNDKVCLIDEKARVYLQKAHASTQHLGQLFQDLLTSAKADDGRLASHPEIIEFGEFLENIVDDLRFTVEKKGLAFEFLVGTDEQHIATNTKTTRVIKPLYYVEVDPDRMREVITNLFDNAVKYTPSGKISIGLTGNAEVVQFYVKDTGGGIPPEDVSHLFQKFYRIDNSATRTIGGTGLGLFICRKIVELYNGRIWVKSQLGRGSIFYVNIPRLDSVVAQKNIERFTQAN